jgi:hypothetical protein
MENGRGRAGRLPSERRGACPSLPVPFDYITSRKRRPDEETIMKYLLLLHRVEDALPEPGTLEAEKMFQEYAASVQAMAKAGVLVDCAPLSAGSSATTVRVRDGETLLTDGPAAELREQVGGYTIIDCAGLDEALGWAASLPSARDASVEVRAVIDTGRAG